MIGDRGTFAAARWGLSLAVAALACAVPFWLWGVALESYFLKLDDFVYVARSRSATAMTNSLFVPHNGHVVPLFLVETHLLCWLAGSLSRLPNVMAWASYLTLVAAMAAVGHVVAWEAGRLDHGLAAMGALGTSTVLGPAVLWYSAGQAIVCGVMILIMLVFLQAWRTFRNWWLLTLALASAAAAPLFWTAGYIAGGVGFAYLYANGERVCRRVALLPILVSLTMATMIFCLGRTGERDGVAGRKSLEIVAARNWWVDRTSAAISHSAQAICESLLFNNLGLDVLTEGLQALVLSSLIVAILAYCRWRTRAVGSGWAWAYPRPLEAAGLAMVVLTFGMIFAVRGTETTFANLRALGWYDAIPQLGAALVVGGWLSGRAGPTPARTIEAPSARSLVGVLLMMTVLVFLQSPRAGRVVLEYDGLGARVERVSDQSGSVPRTRNDLVEQAKSQRQVLEILDRLENRWRARRIDREELERSVAAIAVPGMPEGLKGVTASDLIGVARIESN